MTVPPGDWDKIYDSTLGTTHVDQGWMEPFGSLPATMEDGYLRVYADFTAGGNVSLIESPAEATTVACRFRVVLPIEEPGSTNTGSAAILAARGEFLFYAVFSKDGLKITEDMVNFTVAYGDVDFEDGEFHEVYVTMQLDGTVAVYVDSLEAYAGSSLDVGFAYEQYSYTPAANPLETGEQSVSHVDWFVASYDEVILPEGPAVGPFGDTTVSLGANGAVVEFDEWALYDAPLSETAIQRHWQSSQGIPSL